MMNKTTALTKLKPLFLLSLFTVFNGYHASAQASLSSYQPISSRIVATAATPEQIQATAATQAQVQAITAPSVKTSTLSGESHHVANQKINKVYRQWAGTRYRMGGTGSGGIDCSAFVQKAMSGAFGLDLPRSTSEQRYEGRSISKSDLRPGDLVFFRRNHHVGVYIGNGLFVHASTSQGVTTSSLSESYWARNYTQSRRVL